MSIDLTALSADDIERIASWNPRAIVAALAESNIAVSDTTSTASELNQLHSVTPGAVTASKALVVDSNKRLDAMCVGTLSLGATTGTAVTATATELNQIHSVTAGTVTASKALVVDANSALNALNIVALSLGAGAGTAVTSTAAEINALHSQGAITTDFAKLHAITAAAATLNQVAAAAGTVTFDRSIKVAKVALTALDTGGGVFAWTNPEAGSIIITKVVLDVTTKASAACTVDVGTTAASAATLSDNLIDGADVGTGAVITDNVTDAGTNGKSVLKLATGKWVTGSMASGAAAGLAGSSYIYYLNA